MDHLQPRRLYHRRAILGSLSLAGFAFLYLAGSLFGNDGIEYLFADVDRETVHIAGHIVVYGTLAVMLAQALGRRFVWAWLISNILAVGEEWHQLIVPGRVASVRDALLNVVAITAFLMLASWLATLLGPKTADPSTGSTTTQPTGVVTMVSSRA